jgi:RimJ/RimL family protein N-acetyltransferase
VPRGIAPPDPPLADDLIRLEPLTQAHVPAFVELIQEEAIQRFTLVPSSADEAFVRSWLKRYEDGWDDGSRAGFAANDRAGTFLAFAAIVDLDLDAREGEIGYLTAPAARGQGVAARSVRLLTDWGFEQLGLERLELHIDSDNVASERVAERAGYRRDGVLRSKHFKEGRRADLAVWSRLPTD